MVPQSGLRFGSKRSFLLRNREQRRIELNERIVYGSMLRVARVAARAGGPQSTGSCSVAKAKERPLPREAAFILYFGFHARQSRLIMPAFVDGAFRFGRPNL